MLEELLIEHCSPTLGKLKTASLFNCSFSSETELEGNLAKWNDELNTKGVSLFLLRKCKGRALIYVYRPSMLIEDLKKKGVSEFLAQYGYRDVSPLLCIKRLKERFLNSPEFPHEIGLFLGYPLEDVKGFIENSGQNSKFSGLWKVYGNEYETISRFVKFKKCKEIYKRLFENRIRSVTQLTVAV